MVADWLSRMYPELFDKAAWDRYVAEDAEISCMLYCLIGGTEFEDHSEVNIKQSEDPVFDMDEAIREEAEGITSG